MGRRASIIAVCALLAMGAAVTSAGSAAGAEDVAVIRWATFLGGPSSEAATALVVDGRGALSLGGYTFGAGFPSRGTGLEEGPSGAADAVAASFDREGGETTRSGYLGGGSQDAVHDAVVDDQGAVYLVGETHSSDFPSTSDSVQPGSAGGQDAFIVKLDPDGGEPLWSTYLGGSGYDIAFGAHVGADGALYVTGRTSSSDFPTTSDAIRRELSGRSDIFVVRLSPDGTTLEYGTLFGGSNTDARPTSGEAGRAIATDAAGSVYIVGITDSRDLPTSSAPPLGGRPLNAVNGGGLGDAFVAKLVPGEANAAWSGYLGGVGNDRASAVSVGDDGTVYAAGSTDSPDFPVFMAEQPTLAGLGSFDGWIARIEPGGAGMRWSTFLGGSGSEAILDLQRNDDDSMWLSGYSGSRDFPVTADALQAVYAGGVGDGILARMEGDDGAVRYSTFIGGEGHDAISGSARVSDDTVLLAGSTDSQGFPVTAGAFQPENAGGVDAFVASVGPPIPATSCRTPGPPSVRPPKGPPPGKPC